MKWALRLLCLCYVCAAVGLSWKHFQAERHYSYGQLWTAAGDTLQSFAAMKAAYDEMPWDSRVRMQYVMSLEALRDRKKTKIEKSASDRIYKIAQTASPMHQAVLMSRARYLLNTGQWKEDDEIKGVVIALRNKAKVYPETWLISAYYSALVGDQKSAADYLIRGLKAGGKVDVFKRVAKTINLEIYEQ